jgi:hypothetical protein
LVLLSFLWRVVFPLFHACSSVAVMLDLRSDNIKLGSPLNFI